MMDYRLSDCPPVTFLEDPDQSSGGAQVGVLTAPEDSLGIVEPAEAHDPEYIGGGILVVDHLLIRGYLGQHHVYFQRVSAPIKCLMDDIYEPLSSPIGAKPWHGKLA